MISKKTENLRYALYNLIIWLYGVYAPFKKLGLRESAEFYCVLWAIYLDLDPLLHCTAAYCPHRPISDTKWHNSAWPGLVAME